MLFLFLSHCCSQTQTKQDLATEEKQGQQHVFPHWPSGCLVKPLHIYTYIHSKSKEVNIMTHHDDKSIR